MPAPSHRTTTLPLAFEVVACAVFLLAFLHPRSLLFVLAYGRHPDVPEWQVLVFRFVAAFVALFLLGELAQRFLR
jgi:hypothetical protein